MNKREIREVERIAAVIRASGLTDLAMDLTKLTVHRGRPQRKETPVRLLDDLARQVVLHRDGHKCRRCGTAEPPLDCAHVYSRRHHAVRWDPDNLLTLCRRCHNRCHSNPAEFMHWFRDMIGDAQFTALGLRARKGGRATQEWTRNYLERELAAYGG